MPEGEEQGCPRGTSSGVAQASGGCHPLPILLSVFLLRLLVLSLCLPGEWFRQERGVFQLLPLTLSMLGIPPASSPHPNSQGPRTMPPVCPSPGFCEHLREAQLGLLLYTNLL